MTYRKGFTRLVAVIEKLRLEIEIIYLVVARVELYRLTTTAVAAPTLENTPSGVLLSHIKSLLQKPHAIQLDLKRWDIISALKGVPLPLPALLLTGNLGGGARSLIYCW